jgi:CRISPR system Cascade subunit CasE
MNGYLHRIRLMPGLGVEQLARVLPASAYGEHQLVWRWFGEGADSRDFLFRREQQGSLEHPGQGPLFYVLARREAVDRSGLWDIQSKRFEPRLSVGERLSFVLRANPVKARKISEDRAIKTRRRDDVVADLKKRRYPDPNQRPPMAEIVREAGTAWLAERAEASGFELESLAVDGYRQQRWYKPGTDRPITLSTVEFEGVLRVCDAARFTGRLFQGIGPAKSFGCGLLLIRRLS